jgi:hypothetical protein
MLFSLQNIELKVEEFYETQIDLKVHSVQIDNQLYSAIVPVLLCPLQQPFFTLSIIKRNDYYRYIHLGVKPLTINLDGFFIENMMSYMVELKELIGPREPS